LKKKGDRVKKRNKRKHLKTHLEQAQKHVNNSKSASEKAKTWADVGYPRIVKRDQAVEELRQSIEHLITALEKRPE
jgi:hypothetical protein